jgi:hypothetical protein
MSLIINDRALIIIYEVVLHHIEILGFITSTVFVDCVDFVNINFKIINLLQKPHTSCMIFIKLSEKYLQKCITPGKKLTQRNK